MIVKDELGDHTTPGFEEAPYSDQVILDRKQLDAANTAGRALAYSPASYSEIEEMLQDVEIDELIRALDEYSQATLLEQFAISAVHNYCAHDAETMDFMARETGQAFTHFDVRHAVKKIDYLREQVDQTCTDIGPPNG